MEVSGFSIKKNMLNSLLDNKSLVAACTPALRLDLPSGSWKIDKKVEKMDKFLTLVETLKTLNWNFFFDWMLVFIIHNNKSFQVTKVNNK